MANASNAGTPSPHSLGSGLAALRAHAGWILAFGIVLVIFGVLALGSVLAATIATVFYVGVTMLLAAVAEIILAFRAQSWSKFFIWALLGVLYAAAGVLALTDPLLAASLLTLLLGAALAATGAVRIYFGSPNARGRAVALDFVVRRDHCPVRSCNLVSMADVKPLYARDISWRRLGVCRN